jgi:hypothetical protein
MSNGCGIDLRARKNPNKAHFKESGDPVLGFKNITLLFNLGQAEGGGNLILVQADGELTMINSNDLMHDLPAYELSERK